MSARRKKLLRLATRPSPRAMVAPVNFRHVFTHESSCTESGSAGGRSAKRRPTGHSSGKGYRMRPRNSAGQSSHCIPRSLRESMFRTASALSNRRFGVRLQFVSEVDVIGLFQDITQFYYPSPPGTLRVRPVYRSPHSPSSSGGRGQGEGAYVETRGPADWRE